MRTYSGKPTCSNCSGLGVVVVGQGDGYHLYRQCPVCSGSGVKE